MKAFSLAPLLSVFACLLLTAQQTNAQGNTPPTITDISNQTINEDANTGALAFTIGDVETPAASLAVTGSSSNTTLVPNSASNISIGGSGPSRTVTVAPAANQSGSATITVTVSDRSLTASDTFLLTVNAVNDAPTISAISDQIINKNSNTGALSFTVSDIETAPGGLAVTGTSTNSTLVPNSNIVFAGVAGSQTVTVTPVADQTGTATITVTVSDGSLTNSEPFVLTVIDPVPVEMVSFAASVNRRDAVLRWRTATETDNYGFEVERRSVPSYPRPPDGQELGITSSRQLGTRNSEPEISWSQVGFVAGSGTSTSPHEYFFADENLSSGRYAYRIKQINNDGTFTYTSSLEVEIGIPQSFSLSQNYPNPFNPTTVISYQLPVVSKVDLRVYDLLGREVAILLNEEKSAGYYEVTFDARGLSSGIYYYRIQAGSFVQVKKLMLAK